MIIVQVIALLFIIINIIIFVHWNKKNNREDSPHPQRVVLIQFVTSTIALLVIIALWAPADFNPKDEPYTGEGRYLAQNIPTQIDDFKVIASRIHEDSASLIVVNDETGGVAQSETAALNEEITINGLTLTIIHIDSIGGELKDGETGSDGSAVWIKVTQ